MSISLNRANSKMEIAGKESIKKVLENASSKEEAVHVVNWFSNTLEGKMCLSDLLDRDSYLLEEKLSKAPCITPAQSEAIFKKIENQINKKTFRRNFLKIAAVLLPFVLVVSFGFYLARQFDLFSKVNYSEIYVPKGETLRMFFQDGSELFLNSDTKLRYPDKFGLKNRNVYLEGEAYFNVASNKRRPFVVTTGQSEVVVVGTSFNVSAYKDEPNVQVVLDEGEIIFKTRHNRYTIAPGQKIEYNKTIGTTTLTNLQNSKEASLWKNNILHFADSPLSEVLTILSRSYDVTYIIENSSALKYTYTLTTPRATIESIINDLEKISPVKFHLQGNQLTVDL